MHRFDELAINTVEKPAQWLVVVMISGFSRDSLSFITRPPNSHVLTLLLGLMMRFTVNGGQWPGIEFRNLLTLSRIISKFVESIHGRGSIQFVIGVAYSDADS